MMATTVSITKRVTETVVVVVRDYVIVMDVVGLET